MAGKKALLTVLLALSAFTFIPNATASVLYNWVCSDANCNGDPAFSSSIEITDAAFAAGGFTGVAGNVVSWNTSSGVGDGFSLALSDIASSLGDDVNLHIALNASGSEISDLLDLTSGTNITFFNGSVGRVDFFEGTGGNYSAGSLNDFSPSTVYQPITVLGRFVRASAVPEPSALALVGLGILGVAVARRRVRA